MWSLYQKSTITFAHDTTRISGYYNNILRNVYNFSSLFEKGSLLLSDQTRGCLLGKVLSAADGVFPAVDGENEQTKSSHNKKLWFASFWTGIFWATLTRKESY